MPSQPLYIVLTFDDNFWAPAYATMRSICLASRRASDIVFNLCCRKVTPEHRNDLERITGEFAAQIVWHDLDTNSQFQAALSGLKDSKRLGTVIYARLMLESFLPASARRAIYLDCDMMVRAPIEELWDRDLDGNALAAVPDPWAWRLALGRDIREKRDLFSACDPYFNSGLLVIDLERWRAADVWGQLQAVIANGTMERLYYDQDFLNLTFRNDWLALDALWNLVDPRPAHVALNPKLLHFTGERKPWKIWSGVAFSRLYRHVMTNELYYRYMRYRWASRFRRWLWLDRPSGKAK